MKRSVSLKLDQFRVRNKLETKQPHRKPVEWKVLEQQLRFCRKEYLASLKNASIPNNSTAKATPLHKFTTSTTTPGLRQSRRLFARENGVRKDLAQLKAANSSLRLKFLKSSQVLSLQYQSCRALLD